MCMSLPLLNLATHFSFEAYKSKCFKGHKVKSYIWLYGVNYISFLPVSSTKLLLNSLERILFSQFNQISVLRADKNQPTNIN